jgi:hypothetical protein
VYLVRPGENDDLEGVDDSETERREYVFDHMEAMASEDGLQADERMRDSIDSVGIVLREQIYGSESEEDWEEIVEAGEHIVRATKQIASCGTCDVGESMEDIMQLDKVTVVAGTISVELETDVPVVDNLGSL